MRICTPAVGLAGTVWWPRQCHLCPAKNRSVVNAFHQMSEMYLWFCSFACRDQFALPRRFSEEPSMQVRDASTTLGLLFAGMGLGALLGPFIFNPFTPPK